MANQVGAAIAAVENPPPEQRATIKITLPNGRHALLNAPADLDPFEALALVGFIANPGGLASRLAEARSKQPASRLIVPTIAPMRRV